MEPLIHIILVNYNGFFDTIECVESLKKITYTRSPLYSPATHLHVFCSVSVL